MRQKIRLAAAGAVATLIAGCASGPSSERAPTRVTRPANTPAVVRPPAAADRSGALFGRTAQALTALFGEPALDVREGEARKLQFLGANCVLDAYLYPPGGRGEAVVTHVDTRLPDGRDSDREACIAALRQR